MPSLLVIMIFLPAIAAAALLLLDPQATAVRARWVALLATVATFFVSWGVAAQYMALPKVDSDMRGPVHPQMVLRSTWLDLSQAGPHSPGVKFEFFLGLDGISLSLVMLTTILTISSVLVSWTAIKDRAAQFYACLLIYFDPVVFPGWDLGWAAASLCRWKVLRLHTCGQLDYAARIDFDGGDDGPKQSVADDTLLDPRSCPDTVSESLGSHDTVHAVSDDRGGIHGEGSPVPLPYVVAVGSR